VLKKHRPETVIAVCEPDNSPMLASGIAQPCGDDGSPSESHPSFRTHLVQGWAPDFIPKLTADAVDEGLIDRIVPIDSGEALELSRELARKEGLFTGISGGATFSGALRLAREAREGATLLCMLPDTAERYLSTPLFADIPVEMTEEESEIARSTPNFRFDVCAAPAGRTQPEVPATSEARAFVEQAVGRTDPPVVIFALKWCEFCWSVRKLLDATGIAHRSFELDSPEFDRDDRGGKVRAALAERTASTTMPQLFVGGEFVGGCDETFDAYKSGELQRKLIAAGIEIDPRPALDPYSLLPSWLHSR
jgi:cysteine synthase A